MKAGQRFLDTIEWLGNLLPDPALLFVFALALTWGASAVLANVSFSDIDPRTLGPDAQGKPQTPKPIEIKNQITGPALVAFLTRLVKNFAEFPPLGIVLVAMLGVGVADHTGMLRATIKGLLAVTPRSLVTPSLLLVAILSHTAGDTGYILVIPLGGVIFATTGRHPLTGIVVAFAGVAGGFSCNFVPSGLDPLLQGYTQAAAQLIDAKRQVNPLCNYYFMATSGILIILVGWFLTERVIEPRLRNVPLDGSGEAPPVLDSLTAPEVRGLVAAYLAMAVALLLLALACWPQASPFRSPKGELAGHGSPLMEAIVPLIFLLFLLPGIVYGYVSGAVKSHRDVIKGMSLSMSTMGYYLVLAFCAAQFTYAFRESNLGALVAIKGAKFLQWLDLPPQVTIVGIIVLSAGVDLVVGSASAKWALMGPILVPMLMQVGISPELTQAAYRIGDSCSNILTPLMPYFPLVVMYCQRYVKSTGIGTLVSLMVPYAIAFLITWTLLLLAFWGLGIPLGVQGPYTYP